MEFIETCISVTVYLYMLPEDILIPNADGLTASVTAAAISRASHDTTNLVFML